MQCVKCRTHAHNFVLSTHYYILSRHFLLTRVCLKSNIDHLVGWHAFLNFWGRRVMLPLFHPRQRQRPLEGFYSCHLVQLPQRGSLCTYCTTIFHRLKLGLQYWNSSIHGLKLQKRWWNFMKPSTIDILVVALTMFPSPQPYQEEIVA